MPVQQVRVALRTDSLSEAKRRAPQVEAAKMAEWEAMVAGDAGSARKHYLSAMKLAEGEGWAYRTVDEIASCDLEEVVARVLSLAGPNGLLQALKSRPFWGQFR